MTDSTTNDGRVGGLGQAVGDWMPISVAPQRLDVFAKMIGIHFPKTRTPIQPKTTEEASKENLLRPTKRQDLGYLHYKTWIDPETPMILSLEIVEAEGLEPGYIPRYPYVKIIHGDSIYKTTVQNKAIPNPVWNQTFSIPLVEADVSTIIIEVWATRTMSSDFFFGRTAFMPGATGADPVDVWQNLWIDSSSGLRSTQEITQEMIRWSYRVSKKARERTPELLHAKRMEIRAKKAASIKAEKDALIAAGWGQVLEFNRKKRKMPVLVYKNFHLVVMVIVLAVMIFASIIPGEIAALREW